MLTCVWYALGVRYAASRLLPATRAALPLATLALVLAHARSSAAAADCGAHTGTLFEQFGRAVLTALPAKAPRVMLLTHGDEVHSLTHLLTYALTHLLTYLLTYALTY